LKDGEAICTLKTRFEKKMKRNEKMAKPTKGCRARLMIYKKRYVSLNSNVNESG
jgi:hypothetical protein